MSSKTKRLQENTSEKLKELVNIYIERLHTFPETSIPELEVEENDVVGCGHGTANGPVDESQRFYLMARGLSKEESEDALIAAFLNSTLTGMGTENVHSWLITAVEDALKNLDG